MRLAREGQGKADKKKAVTKLSSISAARPQGMEKSRRERRLLAEQARQRALAAAARVASAAADEAAAFALSSQPSAAAISTRAAQKILQNVPRSEQATVAA